MPMERPISTLILPVLAVFLSLNVFSQALYQVPLDRKISNSTLIIEGKVTNQTSFWNASHSMIYTANEITIYKLFKGTIATQQIEVVTVGGQVANEMVYASDLIKLRKNDIGIFFLQPGESGLKSPIPGGTLFKIYSSGQGFLKYNLSDKTAAAPFVKYRIIDELYDVLQKKTGRSFEDKFPEFKVGAPSIHANLRVAAISSFSPAIVAAGAILDPTNNLLTINGTSFGTASGSAAVIFPDANNGGAGEVAIQWDDPLIVSWSDTKIEIRVPMDAGSGVIKVRDAASAESSSATALDVVYSVFQTYSVDGTLPKEIRLANINALGGYTIQYNNNIAGTPSQATFQRALTTWKELNGYNVTEGANTATNVVANDGFNIVMLDNAGTGNPPLDDGVLGVCYSYFGYCGSPTGEIFKTGFDIVIRLNGFSTGTSPFTIGPCPPLSTNFMESDLETVILHELGHSLNLGHVIDDYDGGTIGELNPGALMNYTIVNSVRRISPDYAAFAGANYAITPKGLGLGGCVTEMVKLSTTVESKDNCPLSFPSTVLGVNTAVTFDLVHATSNRFVDPAFTQVRCDAHGTALTNNAYYAFKTNAAGGNLGITVSGYTTTPAAIAACTPAYAGIPVTGVRLALYQVNSCSTAGSFPAPVSCNTFAANGALSSITGLAANTTYLLYLDGIENTKANFTLTFSGTALPINFSDFTGRVLDSYNQLNWKIDFARDVKSIYLEKSEDGSIFERVANVTPSLSRRKGDFNDFRPFAINNYYRLTVQNFDGTMEYSKVILLKRNDNFLVSVFPNPATGVLHVEINSTSRSGKYSIRLRNNLGQEVQRSNVVVTSSRQKIELNVEQLSSGMYQVSIYDQQEKLVKTTSVRIN